MATKSIILLNKLHLFLKSKLLMGVGISQWNVIKLSLWKPSEVEITTVDCGNKHLTKKCEIKSRLNESLTYSH